MSTKLDSSATLRSYIAGFGLSVTFTLLAYYVVVNNILFGWNLVYTVVLLALAQAIVQLVFFLHLHAEKQPRWNLLVFDFMLLVLSILVFGSIWIMQHLNYHGMTPTQTDSYIVQDEGIQR